jgi:V8-like Glu-specific endopeptidase
MKIYSACLALLLLPHACLVAGKGNGKPAEDPRGPLQIGDHHPIAISSTEGRSDLQPVVSPDGKSSTYTLHHENASYLSVHFSNLDLPPSCSLRIADGNQDQDYTLRGKGKFDLGSFWAHHINGDTMVLTLNCNSQRASATFEIDDYVAGYPSNGAVRKTRHLRNSAALHPPDNFLQAVGHRDLSICGADDKRNAICYKDTHPIEYTKARAVARLYINGSGACTGWLVSESNLLFTNEHCIDSLSDVQNTDFEFMGEEDVCTTTPGDGSWMSNRGVIYDGSALVTVNASWDYALIQLVGNPASIYGHLELDNREASVDEEIYIPQHPGGRPKELGIFDSNHNGNCKVKGFGAGCAPLDMKYSCDTEGGSSGSPVLARSTHKVIALHHCGGACNGNLGAPINQFYSQIAQYITDTPYSASPTSSPTDFPDCPSNEKHFKLSLQTDNYGGETSWKVTSPTSGDVISGSGYGSGITYTENHCIPSDACAFVISDSYGDGICCSYGQGSYTVWVDDVEKGAGGDFGNTETIPLCDVSPTPSPNLPPTVPPTPSPTVPPTPSPTVPPTPSPTVPPTVPPTPLPTSAPVSCLTVKINILTDYYPGETSWTISDQEGNEVASGNGYTQGQTNYIQDQCLERNKAHTFSISDTWGDGICCGYGNGSYQLSLGETIFIEGGEFGSSVEHTFVLVNLDTVLIDHTTCAGEAVSGANEMDNFVKKGTGEKCKESQHCLSSKCGGDGTCQ